MLGLLIGKLGAAAASSSPLPTAFYQYQYIASTTPPSGHCYHNSANVRQLVFHITPSSGANLNVATWVMGGTVTVDGIEGILAGNAVNTGSSSYRMTMTVDFPRLGDGAVPVTYKAPSAELLPGL